MEEKEKYRFAVHIILFILAITVLIFLLRPVFTILLLAIMLSYLSFPLYIRLRKRLKWHLPAGIITILVIILVVSLPFSLLLVQIGRQSTSFYQDFTQGLSEGSALGVNCSNGGLICTIVNNLDVSLTDGLNAIGLDSYLQTAIEQLITVSTRYLVSIPGAILGLGFSLLMVYYLLKDWKNIGERVLGWIPLRRQTTSAMVDKFKKVTHAVVYGQILVAIAQGVVSGIGYFIFGIPYPVFWGAVTAFAALIPSVGTALIWVPASIILFLAGYLSGDTSMVLKAIGLLIYGLAVISTIDNVLRVKVGEKRAQMHPMVTLIGIIGGIPVFGVLGIFFGPLVLALLITFFDNFKEKYC